jgi:hypothetical protein
LCQNYLGALPPLIDLFHPDCIATAAETNAMHGPRRSLFSEVGGNHIGTVRFFPPWLGVLRTENTETVLLRLADAIEALQHVPLPDARPSTGDPERRALAKFIGKWFYEGYGRVPYRPVADLVNVLHPTPDDPVDEARIRGWWSK